MNGGTAANSTLLSRPSWMCLDSQHTLCTHVHTYSTRDTLYTSNAHIPL